MTFAQGQIILNCYYGLDFYPFLRTSKPEPHLSATEREGMLDRIRAAKDELFRQGHKFPDVRNEELDFVPEPSEVADLTVALAAILIEGRQDPLNVQPLIGARLDDVEALIRLLEPKGKTASGSPAV
jgi:hypothetical protein